MAHQVTIHNTGEAFHCAEGVHVLAAMELARCHGIPVGCRNGGCGACKVRITTGRFQTRKMNRAVISVQEEAEGCVLACKTYPLGDIAVQVLGRAWQASTSARNATFTFGFKAPNSVVGTAEIQLVVQADVQPDIPIKLQPEIQPDKET
jgi:ferredoxin